MQARLFLLIVLHIIVHKVASNMCLKPVAEPDSASRQRTGLIIFRRPNVPSLVDANILHIFIANILHL